MEKQDALSEEIVIVGSRHGELADIVKPIYEKGDPVKEESIRGLLGLDMVILWPSDEDFDKYGVRVLTCTFLPISVHFDLIRENTSQYGRFPAMTF